MATVPILARLDRCDAWLAGQCDAIPAALARRCQVMARDPGVLRRGVAFRCAARCASADPALAAALRVPGCGDAHIENFCAWRDAEGRLVWRANDLQEAVIAAARALPKSWLRDAATREAAAKAANCAALRAG